MPHTKRKRRRRFSNKQKLSSSSSSLSELNESVDSVDSTESSVSVLSVRVYKGFLSDRDVERIAAAVKNTIKTDFTIDILSEVQATVRKVFDEFSEVVVLKQEINTLKSENENLRLSIDELEQYGRRNAVRISGIPEKTGEDTDAIVRDVANKMGVDIHDVDISRSHRSGKPGQSRPRQILVKFVRYNTKRKLLISRRVMKSVPSLNNVFINDDLTKRRQELYRKARDLWKDRKITKTWTWDGKIFLTDKTNKKFRIDRECDLDPFRTPRSMELTTTTYAAALSGCT
ncbi:hypothetical protein KUTeg_017331 [Tegillarca granosa]|uniref:Zinc finger DNA binding protein n=2 Tax=Tegillarca granosa TaxID=220873 RepID=A0ABQ9EMF9_TEGGR|nr:hypothetical protein KUTeg_017331 [Tegillarca granosa]